MGRLYELVKQILLQEEIAKTVAEQVKVEIPKLELPSILQPILKVIDRKSLSLKGYKIKGTGSGTINSILIVSPSSSFNLTIQADRETKYEGSYTDYSQITAGLEDTDGNYRISLNDIPFQAEFNINIQCSTAITFSRIFLEVLGINLQVIEG